MQYKESYIAAHKKWFEQEYPNAFRAGHYTAPILPKVKTANGLTKFIMNFINWNGYRATRINVQGRKIGSVYIRSSTRRGTADLSCTINGKSLMIEIKVGKDKPSEYQLKEQAKERKAGGEYVFVGTPEEFLEVYQRFVSL